MSPGVGDSWAGRSGAASNPAGQPGAGPLEGAGGRHQRQAPGRAGGKVGGASTARAPFSRAKRICRLVLFLVLTIYSVLFLRWSFQDQVGPGLSVGQSVIMSRGMLLGAKVSRVWSGAREEHPSLCMAPLPFALQALYLAYLGPRPSAPLLPVFLLYLLALAAVYRLTEDTAGPVAGLIAVALGLSIDLFSFWPLTSDPVEPAAICLVVLAFAGVLTARGRWALPAAAVGGLLATAAIASHWYSAWYVLLLFLALVSRTALQKWPLQNAVGAAGCFAATCGASLAVQLRFGSIHLPVLLRRLREAPTAEGMPSGLPVLGSRLLVDLEQSMFWPPSIFGFRGGEMIALGVLVLLVLHTVFRGVWARRRRLELLALGAMVLASALPLSFVFIGGAHHQTVLVWMIVAGSVAVAFLLRRQRRLTMALVVAAGLVAGLVFLGREWRQTSRSTVFRRLVYGDHVAQTSTERWPTCEGGRCRAFFTALSRLQRAVLQREAGNWREWGRRGLCSLRTPTMCDSFPSHLLCTSYASSDGQVQRVPKWELELQRLRWPRLVDPSSGAGKELPLLSRPLSRAADLSPGSRCRWLVAIDRKDGSSGTTGMSKKTRRALSGWSRWCPGSTVRQVVRRKLGPGLWFTAWHADQRK